MFDRKYKKQKHESMLSHCFAQNLVARSIEIITGAECEPLEITIVTELLQFDPHIAGAPPVQDGRAIMQIDLTMSWIDPLAPNRGSHTTSARFRIEQFEALYRDKLWHCCGGEFAGSLTIGYAQYRLGADQRPVRPKITIAKITDGTFITPFGEGTCLKDRIVY